MTATQPAPLPLHRGIVKCVLSADTVVIRGQPKGGPPPEKTLCLAGITAPKLSRRPNPNAENQTETKDDPFAWEAREFLRKKLIGKEVSFVIDYNVANREYGYIYLGKDATCENLAESLVSEGLVEARKGKMENEKTKKLTELEEQARVASKGKWGTNLSEHVRDIKWTMENPQKFKESHHGKPIKAVVEHVRDGCTVRAFLLPDFHYVTVMLSGIRCPMFRMATEEGGSPTAEPFAEEARFFTESRLLQRDVEIILESVPNNNYFLGSILHPNGNISEALLREGFAKCMDWRMNIVSTGIEKLRAAEKYAKEKRLRLWKDFSPSTKDGSEKELSGKVVEVVNADALVVKLADNTQKKIFLASIRPPRLENQGEAAKDNKGKPNSFRPLYDIPYMYEAREFLRKKLIGKKITIAIDYIQPASNAFPEKTCCTVTISGINVAEALVSKGLASVVRYRQDDDQRSSHYDELMDAEMKAIKSAKGIHSKKDSPIHRVADISGDVAKAKQFFPFLQRAGKLDAVVEYVASGSRLRVYVPRETCLITFLLAGINCPRGPRTDRDGTAIEGDLYGEQAHAYTKELVMQHEVEIEVENIDKAGNYIGWLTVEGTNLSVALVEEGLSSVHVNADRSPHFRALKNAEEAAKHRKDKIWANFEEQKEPEIKEDMVQERNINYKSVVITEILPDFRFYVQYIDQGPELEKLMEQLREEFKSHPPLVGSYTPKKGDLCAAKFIDNQWYRAKVEQIKGGNINILYVDYGNRETTNSTKLAALPGTFNGQPPFAHEHALACIAVPKDAEYQDVAVKEFGEDTEERTVLMNVEYRVGNLAHVTLVNSETKDDIGKNLISDGLLMVESRNEKRLHKLVSDYKSAQDDAKKKRINMWEYGDFTGDDAKEFGYSR